MLRFLTACPARAVRRGLRVAALFVTLLLLAPFAAAQQFVVDDAGITDEGACQFEGWLSETSGWLLPACTPIARTEITLGIGYVDEPHGDHTHRHVEYVAQAKVNLLPDDPGALGVSIVGGFGFGPFAQATGVPVEGIFAYLPATYTLANERAFLHLNGGWAFEIEDRLHRAIYGARADVVLHDYVTVIGEVFGEGPDVGVQGGLRINVIPDLFAIDASYGTSVHGDTPDIGFAFGIAITPRPFFRPVRF